VDNNTAYPPALFIMGPTASGKTALAVQLADLLNGEIISVDSALVYKGMDIGTAKPTAEERGGIPHHLIDILDPSQAFSTGQFRTQALALMADISGRGKIPILVGGTFLYFKALSGGLAVLPEADPLIRVQLDADLAQLGKMALHQKLAQIDPEAAARIHPNDPQRVQRALEVFAISGQPISSFFKATSADLPYHITKIAVSPSDRKILHGIIAQRFQAMLDNGLINEVEKLFNRGDLHEKMPAIRAVGYRQIWAYLQGETDKATMTEQAIAATRQLAKRQFTWLRKETDVLMLETGATDSLQQVLSAMKPLW